MENNSNKILFILVVAIICSVNVWFIIEEVKYLPSNEHFDWGSLVGGVVGGLLTLGGVIITIKYEKVREKDKLRQFYLPFIQAVGDTTKILRYLKEQVENTGDYSFEMVDSYCNEAEKIYSKCKDEYGDILREFSPTLYQQYMKCFDMIADKIVHIRNMANDKKSFSKEQFSYNFDKDIKLIFDQQGNISKFIDML